MPPTAATAAGAEAGVGVAYVHQCFVAIDAAHAMPGTYCACVCVCTSRLRFFPAFLPLFFVIENKFLTILLG